MDMERKYNTRNPAVKRLMREACELKDPTDEYFAKPLDDNLFEWHFTVHGSPSSDFEGGVYHGRILLPAEYPMKPPNIILLTPNGRFETYKKICLSISGHHPETWQPSWSIRTALLALIAFMSSPGNGAIGSLDYTPEERRQLAKKSKFWECPQCGNLAHLLTSSKSKPVTQEESDLINRIALEAEDPVKKETEDITVDAECARVLLEMSKINEENSVENEDLQGLQHDEEEIVESSENNSLRSLMWLVIAAIVLLIARRLFFLL